MFLRSRPLRATIKQWKVSARGEVAYDGRKKTMRRESIRGTGERSLGRRFVLERAHLRAIRSQVANPQVASIDPNDGPTLDTLKAGQCAIIKAVRGHGEVRRHLLDMGLTPGIGVRACAKSLRWATPVPDRAARLTG